MGLISDHIHHLIHGMIFIVWMTNYINCTVYLQLYLYFFLYLYVWYYIYMLDDKLFKLLSVSPQSIYAFLAEPLNWQRNVYEFPRRNIPFHPQGNMVDRYCVNIFFFFWEIRLCKLAKYDSPEKFSVAMIFTEMTIMISVILIWWWCL